MLASAGLQIAILGVASPAVAAPAPNPAPFSRATPGAFSGTVPDGACFVVARVIGGAGGNSLLPLAGQATAVNGAAASISARYSVVPGESFAGIVGGGGAQTLTAGSNGGGNGGTIVSDHAGAGGGGWTSLQLDGVDVVVAGGGGGSAGGHPNANEGSGGNAGLPTGAGVTAGSAGLNGADSSPIVEGGRGGGPVNPGAGGTNNGNASYNGASGAGRTGGNGGPDQNFDSGGGGGGGFLGGGGGASTVSSGVTGGGGGGGASFVAATSPGGSGTQVSNITSSPAGVRSTNGAGQNGSVSLDFVPCGYDLAVTKDVDDATPAPGDTVTWTVKVTSNGADPMTRGDVLTIDDSLPGPGAKTITSVTVTGGINNRGLVRGAVDCGVVVGDPMPATLTCARPYADGVNSSPDTGTRGIDLGESVTITYTQQIPVGTPSRTSFTNVATVTDRGATGNNADDAVIVVQAGPPVATDDSANTPFNTPVDLPATGNDSPSDPGTPLVPGLTVFTSPDATNNDKTLVTPQGTWEINLNGTVTFTPAAGYTGTTPAVEYQITDAAGSTDTADLTVTVRPGPSASPDTDTTAQGVTVVLDPGALSNDTPGLAANGTSGTFDAASLEFVPGGTPGGSVSVDRKTLTIPGQGVFTIDAVTGEVRFAPEPQFTGTTAAAAYVVTDSLGNDASSTITIVVAAVVPVANDDSANTPFNTAVTLPAATDDSAGAPSAPLDPSATVLPAPTRPTVARPWSPLRAPGRSTRTGP